MMAEETDTPIGSQGQTAAGSTRLMSLDALRGFDMFWIIGGGEVIRELLTRGESNEFLKSLRIQLGHVHWEGFHAWDLIMPLFLFIVGVAMPFSFAKRLERGDSKRQLYIHIIKRVAILCVLALISKGQLQTYDWENMQIFTSTLQAIAMGYLIASIVMLNMKVRWQIVTVAALLLLYWALVALVPVPGYGAGVFTENGNLVSYLDNLILGHRQRGTGFRIISLMTFGCTVLLGVLAGHLLRSEKTKKTKVVWLFAAAVGCLLLGLLWDNRLPIIKKIWTGSFVLFAAGWSYLLLALFYLIIDVWGLRKWAFAFVVIGMNAIAVYMATQVFDFRLIGDIFVAALAKWTGHWHEFVRAVAGFTAVWLILWWMYRKKSFIKI
jgi:predicted acyltransferase